MVVSLTRRSGLNGRANRARLFYSNSRRRSLYDPAYELFVTHRLGVTGNIDTDVRFPQRNKPITFSVWLKKTPMASNGIVFEMGDSSNGVAMWVNNSSLGVAVGTNSGNNGVSAVANTVLMNDNIDYRIVFSVVPGLGLACVWVRGKPVISARSANNLFSSGWAGTGDGAVGSVNGTVNSRVPAASRVNLQGTIISQEVKAYQGQVPHHPCISGSVSTPPSGSFSDGFSDGFDN